MEKTLNKKIKQLIQDQDKKKSLNLNDKKSEIVRENVFKKIQPKLLKKMKEKRSSEDVKSILDPLENLFGIDIPDVLETKLNDVMQMSLDELEDEMIHMVIDQIDKQLDANLGETVSDLVFTDQSKEKLKNYASNHPYKRLFMLAFILLSIAYLFYNPNSQQQ